MLKRSNPSFWQFVTLTLLSTLLTLQAAHADNPPPLIHVVAEGKASAKPDQAQFELTFSTTKMRVEQARAEVDQQVKDLLAKLNAFELDTASLDSSQTQIYPQYEYQNNQQQFLGYQVTRQVSFKLNSLEQLDPLVQTITESKISQLNQIQFILSDPELIKQEALANAIDRSRLLAQKIADGYEVKLGKIHQVTLQPAAEFPMMRMMAMEAKGAAADAVSDTYQQKELEFKANIDVAFTFH